MRVVISGGSGLIGQALCRELLAAGMEVRVLSRHPAQVRGMPAGVEVLEWDARSSERLAGRLGPTEAVVHLAGENMGAARWSKKRKRLLLDSRLSPGAALAQAVLEMPTPPQVLIQASAVGYYGARRDELLDEGSPVGDGWLPRLVVHWEASTAAVEAIGVRRPIVRSGVVLAPAGGALARMLPLFRLGIAGPLGGGRQWFSWIHIADEVSAIRFLLEHPTATGPFNVTSPHPVTNAVYTASLARVLRRPARLPVPSWFLVLLYGEMATMLLASQRVVPRRLLELGFAFRFPDIELALQDLLRTDGPQAHGRPLAGDRRASVAGADVAAREDRSQRE